MLIFKSRKLFSLQFRPKLPPTPALVFAIPCSDQSVEKVILILIKYGFIILKTIKFYCQVLRGEDVLLISGGLGDSHCVVRQFNRNVMWII